MKRVLTIQDLSCYGKCSLTIALPVISAMGVEAVPLPTAVLSAHTMFKGFTFTSFTNEILPMVAHWRQLDIHFDGIAIGYLGGIRQIEMMRYIIHLFKHDDTFVLLDPAMADYGRLYKNFNHAYVDQICRLCLDATVVLPNLTEACLMTKTAYQIAYDEAFLQQLCLKLAHLGAHYAVITGVSINQNMTGIYGYDQQQKEFFHYQTRRIDANYHGTGDLFTSVVAGAMAKGKKVKEALTLACDYTALTIEKTRQNKTPDQNGVDFEETLPNLFSLVSAGKAESD